MIWFDDKQKKRLFIDIFHLNGLFFLTRLFYKNNKVTFIPVECSRKSYSILSDLCTLEISIVYSTFSSDQQKLIFQCLYLIVVAMQILCRFSEFSKIFP